MRQVSAWLIIVGSSLSGFGCYPESVRPLLFQATLPGEAEDVYKLDVDTGEVTRLTTGEAAYANSFPTWSPVDDRLAFVRQRRQGIDSLFVMAPDSLAPHPLPTSDLAVLGPPSWSPDGRSILISAGNDLSSRRLYVADVDDRSFAEVSLPEGVFDCGSYSPAGARVVASRSLGPRSEVVIIDLADGILDVIAASDSVSFHCPEWSPEGDRIGVTAYSRDYSSATLALVDLRSGEFRELPAGPGYNNAFKWSPDGAMITYQCTDGTPQDSDFYQRMEICLANWDGSGRRQLTRNRYFDAHPSW